MRNFEFAGRLTADPETKTTSNGTNLCTFSIAVRESKEKTHFFNCTAWKGTADLIAQYAKKGSALAVSGEVEHQVWEQDGDRKFRYGFTVHKVTFLSSKSDGAGSSGGYKESSKGNTNDGFGSVVDGPPFDDSGIPFDDIPF